MADTDILILYPQINEIPSPKTLLELGTYVEVLKMSGFKVGVWIVNDQPPFETLAETLKQEKARIVFYYLEPRQYGFLRAFSPSLKEIFSQMHFCCGGPLSTLDPESVISIMGVDSLVIGEGEAALVEFAGAFLKGKEYNSVRNFWFKTPLLDCYKNPLRPLLDNLDQLSFPDRSFYSTERLLDLSNGAIPVLASRGCPYNCLFCPQPHIRDIYRGKGEFYRIRSVNHLIGEILELRAHYSFSRVLFADEIFPTSKEWLAPFAERYHSQVNIPFKITCAVEQLDKKTIEYLLMAGCEGITIGIETGNEFFRKRFAGRNIGNEKITSTVRMLQDVGIAVHVNNLIGLPFETEELIRETYDFNKALAPDKISVNVLFPIPTTPMYNYSREKKYISERNPLNLGEGESVLDIPGLSPETLKSHYFKLRSLYCERLVIKAGPAQGFFDFLHNFSHVTLDDHEQETILCDDFTLGLETRLCLAQIPNTKWSVSVYLQPQTYLKFGIGLEPVMRQFDEKSAFRYTIVLIQGQKEQTIFEKYLAPGKEPKDLGWFEYELPLLDIQEGSALLRFEFRSSVAWHPQIRGLWVHPFLSERKVQVARDQAPFTELEFAGLQKKLLQTRLIYERAEKEKSALVSENERFKKEREDLVLLVGKLEKQILDLDDECGFLKRKIGELEEIKRAYENTLFYKIHAFLRKR